jgi:hypothetical protein
VLGVDASAGHPVADGAALRFGRQCAVLDEAGCAARGHAAEQLVDLEPEQRDEGLAAGVGQIRAPARGAGAKHPVLVDPDDGADRRALGAIEAGESPIEIGGAEALLGEQGPGLRAVRRMKLRKRLDVVRAAERWSAQLQALIEQQLRAE